MKRFRISWVLVLLTLSLGCSADQPPTEGQANAVQSKTVRLSIDAQLQDSQLTVDGATDLPDGAAVRCEASYQGTYDDNVVQNYETLIDLGKATVAQQAFSVRGDVRRLPPGRNKAFCAFMPAIDEQPQHVYDAYGRTGQHLSGSNVYQIDETLRSVEAESFFEKR